MKIIRHIKGDLSGALSAAVITLPISIGYGMLVYAPLGVAFSPQGALAGVYAAVFAGFVADAQIEKISRRWQWSHDLVAVYDTTFQNIAIVRKNNQISVFGNGSSNATIDI